MPVPDPPPLPQYLSGLEAWSQKAGVEDLLGQHIAEICDFVDSSLVQSRLRMAPASATIREVVVNGNISKAFLTTDALKDLGSAVCGFLLFHSKNRALAAWREHSWWMPLPSSSLSDMATRLKNLLKNLGEYNEVWRPVRFTKATSTVLENPDRYHLEFQSVTRASWVRSITCEIDLDPDGEGVSWSCTCSGDHPGELPCRHLRVGVEWLLDAIYDPEHAHRDTLFQVLGVPQWQRMLGEMERAAPASEPETERDERLVWKVNVGPGYLEVEPSVQKITTRGTWSPGRQVGTSQVLSFFDDADAEQRRVILAYAEIASGRHDIDAGMGRLLELLAGHPFVFDAGSPTCRLEVVTEPANLCLRVAGESELEIGVLMNGQVLIGQHLEDALVTWQHLVSLDRTRGLCSVMTLPSECEDLMVILERFSEVRVPVSGLDRTLQVLSKFGEWLSIDVDPSLEVVRRSAEASLLVRLRAMGEGGLDLAVRTTWDDGRQASEPGQGPRDILQVDGGQVVQLQRDLQDERARADALAARLDVASRMTSPYRYRLSDPEQALDALLALRDVGDEVKVEWSDVGGRTYVHRASPNALKVRLESRGRLFGVHGEVEVDGEAVPLSEVLEALGRGERWVRLGPGRFARIEAKLRRALETAARVSSPDRRGGAQLAAATAAHLQDLLGDEVQLEGDRAYAALLERVRTAGIHQPEVSDHLKCELRSYQREGFCWLARLASWGAGAVLADEMGLGKTVQTLAVLLDRADLGPALVVAPTSVCGGWLTEAKRFAPTLDVVPYRGPDRSDRLPDIGRGTVLVASYAVMSLDAEALEAVDFATLVVDEAQFAKNPGTRRAKALRRLSADWAVALTGTPLENHLGELWSIFHIVSPGLLGSWKHFRDRYAVPVERHGDQGALQALRRHVRPFLLRRTKSEVAPELPPRTEVVRPVVLSAPERRLYEAVRRRVLDSYLGGTDEEQRFELLAAITKLRLLACHPRLTNPKSTAPSAKLEEALDLIDDLLAGHQRALVFSQFTRHLAIVRESLDQRGIDYLYLDGSTPAAKRSELVDAWQNNGHGLFLLSMKAGGTGLNLMGADCVIHLDPWWNPAVEDQATDRTHRIGQTRPVTVIRLISQETIEEAVVELHETKRELARGVLEGARAAAALSTDELVGLIQQGGMVGGEPADDEENPDGAAGSGADAVDADPPGPSEPDDTAACDVAAVAGLVADFAVALNDERSRGRITTGTAKIYVGTAERFLEFARGRASRPGAPRSLGDWADRYLEALADGSFDAPRSELKLARTVLNRMRGLANEDT